MKAPKTSYRQGHRALIRAAGVLLALACMLWAAGAVRADDAQTIKEQGDRYAREGDFTRAAQAYEDALSGPVDFGDDERLDMATVMAWGGKLGRSRRELTALLEKNPQNAKARVQRGRVFFWMGEMDQASRDAQEALKLAPADRDATLLSADVARVQGDQEKAVDVYQSVLTAGEHFEARVGLAYAYLAQGKVVLARQSAEKLSPELPYQRQEAATLQLALAEAEKPRTPSPDELARLAAREGNRLAEAGRHQDASEEYAKALSLSGSFTADEQLRMASVMSWAGNLAAARERLTKILTDHPEMSDARIHLARVLLWSGEYDAALREIDRVLALEPSHREALLVRASGLRMTRNYRPAVALYSQLVLKQDDYDAREGLTYSYLQSGDRVAADQSLPLLKPAFAYEEKSLGELKELRDITFNPSVAPGFTFYSDSDQNQVWRFFAAGSVWLKNWKTTVDYTRTDGRDASTTGSSDRLFVSTYSRMPFYGGVGGGVGLMDSGRGVAWSLRGDVDIPNGSVGARVGVDSVSDTAGVIEHHVKALTAGLSGVYRATDRITLLAGYHYRDYSDDNSAHDVMGQAGGLIWRRPAAVAAGYRIRYMNFRRQSGHGYFDPQNFVAHVLFVTTSFEHGRFYGYAEPYGGYQSFTRNEEGNYNMIIGGAGLLGYRFSKHAALEASAEGGNSAVGASGAYNYYQLGARLILTY